MDAYDHEIKWSDSGPSTHKQTIIWITTSLWNFMPSSTPSITKHSLWLRYLYSLAILRLSLSAEETRNYPYLWINCIVEHRSKEHMIYVYLFKKNSWNIEVENIEVAWEFLIDNYNKAFPN